MVSNAANSTGEELLKGFIKGRIIDASTEEGVPYASIIIAQDGKTVGGNITDTDGRFIVKDLQEGNYLLTVQFMGYESKSLPVSVGKKADQNVGLIKIKPSDKVLDGVTVSSERIKVQQQLGKKVVNITPELIAGNTNIAEVLQQIPDVNIDGDGKISLRGESNVRVLIDNKPTQLSAEEALKSLSPELVDRIDVITNPSAKYDPEGLSGIINIITKKNNIKGFNGATRLSLGTNDKYMGGMNFNYRVNKFNFFVEANAAKRRFVNEKGFTRTFDNTENVLSQNQTVGENSGFQQYKIGTDYFIDSVNTLSFYYQYFKWQQEGKNPFEQNLEDAQNKSTILGNSTSKNVNEGHQFDLNYRRDFKNGFLESDLWAMDGHGQFSTSNSQHEHGGTGTLNQRNSNFFTFQIFVPSFDYTLNINKKHKVELGYKGEYLDAFSNSENFNGSELHQFGYDYNGAISGLYSTYSTQINKLQLQAGLRAERASQTGIIKKEGQDTPFTYSYNSLFPSLTIVEPLNKKSTIGFSYSRRVRRPNIDQIAPFEVYSDPQNVQRGNPNLKPSFTNSLELSYNLNGEKYSLSVSPYTRLGNDVIRSYSFFDEQLQANVSTFDNLGSVQTYGLSLSGDVTLFKWWTTSGGVDLTHIDFNDTTYNIPNRPNMNTNFKWNNTFTLPAKFKLVTNANYSGYNYGLQNTSDPAYALTMTLSRNILQNKGNLSLRAQNIVYSGYRNHVYGLGFEEENFYIGEQPIYTVNFSYRFGNMKIAGRKRKINTQGGL